MKNIFLKLSGYKVIAGIVGIIVVIAFMALLMMTIQISPTTKPLKTSSAAVSSGPITNDPSYGSQLTANGKWAIESDSVNMLNSGTYKFSATLPSSDIIPATAMATATNPVVADPISVAYTNDVGKACRFGAVTLTKNSTGSNIASINLTCSINQDFNGTTVWFVG
jgi:hypothetical protein